MRRRSRWPPIHAGAKPYRGPATSPGDMEPIIAGRDLRKSWGATLVLEHADFLLHAGDKVALVGPNGSGTSTLFRLLAGETTPDLGDLVLTPGLRYGSLPPVPHVPPATRSRRSRSFSWTSMRPSSWRATTSSSSTRSRRR